MFSLLYSILHVCVFVYFLMPLPCGAISWFVNYACSIFLVYIMLNRFIKSYDVASESNIMSCS